VLILVSGLGTEAPLLAIGASLSAPGRHAGFHPRTGIGIARELRPRLTAAGRTWAPRGAGPVGAGLVSGQGWLGVRGAAGALWLGRRLGGHSGDQLWGLVEWTDSLALLLMAGDSRGAG